MSPIRKGLVLAAIHVVIVSSLGAKFLYDRSSRPRVWVETVAYDPDMPIRGRYVSLAVVVDAPGIDAPAGERRWETIPIRLAVEGDRLVAHRDTRPDWAAGHSIRFVMNRDRKQQAILADPVEFFLPEHVEDPSRRPPDERLWVEVTLPRKGPPRPIRLGVKKGDTLTPLQLN